MGPQTETGTDSIILDVGSNSGTVFSVAPGIEFGGDFMISETTVLRTFGGIGLSYFADTEHALAANFVNAPTGTPGFMTTADFDNLFTDLSAGATAFFENGNTLGVAYSGSISGNAQQHSISLKATANF